MRNQILKFFHSLTPAIDTGLIITLSELDEELLIQDYKFGHDRIQQAAYTLIEPTEKPLTHLKIGRLLWENTQPDDLSEKIFKIVDHLNLGYELITDRAERDEIAKLNLLAGEKAKVANAYEAAFKYLNTGKNLLAEDSWKTNYKLTLNIYSEIVEVAYLSGNFEEMENFYSLVLQKSQTLLDKVKVYEVKIDAYHSQNKELESIQIALPVLQKLNCIFPESHQLLDIQQELEKTQSYLAGKQIEDLINLPPMTDPEKLAAMKITSSIFSSVFIAAPEMLPLLVYKQVNLSIQHGNTSLSAFAYVNYGLILCGLLEEFEQGYQFGCLAINLADKFHAKEVIPRITAVFITSISIWKKPLKNLLASLKSGYQVGLEVGDLYYGTICAYLYLFHSAFVGKDLSELSSEVGAYELAFSKLKQKKYPQLSENIRSGYLQFNGSLGQSLRFDWGNLPRANDDSPPYKGKRSLRTCGFICE